MGILYHIKNDQRSIRSAETIYDALSVLIGTQDFESIKISELVVQAQVGRATFYRNFDAIEDVLHWRCEQTIDELFNYLQAYGRSEEPKGRMPLLKPLLRFFYLNSTLIELLIKAKRTDLLQTVFQKRLERLQPVFAALLDVPQEYLSYGPVIRSSVAINILVHWVKGGKKQAPDELADGLREMVGMMRGGNRLI